MNENVSIYLSTQADGSMSKAVSDKERLANRTRFLALYGLAPKQAILVHLTYNSNDYRRYFTVGTEQSGDGITQESSIVADTLFTSEKNVALLLPVADCIGAVVYDPKHQVLGLAHLGRHNLEQQGGERIVGYMQSEFGSIATDLQVWLSPAAGRENYPLYNFENRSLHEVALEQLLTAGVTQENISTDTRDTTTDRTLFSHSEFLKGNRDTDGRQAVVCMMKP